MVAAILLNMDTQWPKFAEDVIVATADTPRQLLFQRTELKGKLLFKAIRKNSRYADAAKQTLSGVLAALVKHGVHVFHGAIDRAGRERFIRRFDVRPNLTTEHREAFHECFEHLNDHALTFLPHEKVLWIHDNAKEESGLKTELMFLQMVQVIDVEKLLRDRIHELREDATPSPIMHPIYFGHSHESLALQVADVCCTTIAMKLIDQPHAEPFYELIRRNLVTDGRPIVYSHEWGGRNVQ